MINRHMDSNLGLAPNQNKLDLHKHTIWLGVALAAVGFIYAYGIEFQEFVCAFGSDDSDAPELGVILVGFGRVGQQLLEEMLQTTMSGKTNVIEPVHGGPRFRILCVADSTACLCATRPLVEPATVDTNGLDGRQLASILHHKREDSQSLRYFPFAHNRQSLFRDVLTAVESVPHHMTGGGHIVVVDVSSTELTAPALAEARKFGMGSVIANKKALAVSQDLYDQIKGPHMWQEATVSSAVPVMTSLRRLLMTNDLVESIEGVLSGSIEFMLTSMQAGSKFSEAVIEAQRRGYMETDPRDDLSGLDVARKALIIGRFLDWELEMEDFDFHPLLGKRGWTKKEMSTEKFMSRLSELDAEWTDRVARAKAAGKVLRYVARLTRSTIIHDRQKGTLLDHQKPKESGAVAIGVHEVDPNSQLGALTGSDNVVLVESNLFKNGQELMLHGPGGGLDRTVAAVKADLYLCAMEMPRHHVIGAGHLF